MHAFRKNRGLVNWDWYFGERMETNSVCEKDTKRKDFFDKRIFIVHFIGAITPTKK